MNLLSFYSEAEFMDIFLCILHSPSNPDSFDDESLDPGLVTKVTDSLRMMYLLETWRRDALDGISTALKLSRIMCTFLAGNAQIVSAQIVTLTISYNVRV